MATESSSYYRQLIYELVGVPYNNDGGFTITIKAGKTKLSHYNKAIHESDKYPGGSENFLVAPLTMNTDGLQFEHAGPDDEPEGTVKIHWCSRYIIVSIWVSHPNCTGKYASKSPGTLCAYQVHLSAKEVYERLSAHTA